ncbi:MAG: amidohydrolase [Isosphaeraceae bacterium]|nr:amidohydrolase [Isosphaeraceae bacterium]
MPILRTALVLGLLAGIGPSSNAQTGKDDDAWFHQHRDEFVGLYTDLHRHPELSFQEVKTAQRVADELRKAGADVTTGVGKLGVVGVFKNGVGKTVLVRTDLDALPVTEETGLPYASKAKGVDASGKEVGVMHACGHDMHMACLVGTARWLSDHKDQWSGTVVFIGQPAEEMIGGAKEMLKDGLYTRFPKPDYALALHVVNDQPVGTVAYTSGPALAGSTSVDITIKGRGGHGAAPHTAVDPIVVAAFVIVDLQTVVSREIDPIHPSVLTVGSIHGGTKHNIIPEEVKLQLTLRAYSEEVRSQLIEGLKRRVFALAKAHRAPDPIVTVHDGTPPTINTPELVKKVVPALIRELGPTHIKEVEPVMGAEDFGLFSQGGVPIFMFRLGTISPERMAEAKQKGLPSLHSPQYYPEPAPSLQTGIRAMTAAVRELLPPKS